jgi:NTP pyrophosphatase (non-canonical NTP hydrolase)
MTLNDYQEKAMSFRKPEADATYALLQLAGEVGELYSHIAKAIRDGITDHAAHHLLKKKELGDIMWAIAAVAKDHGWELDDVAQTNIDKLTDRQQRGVLRGSGDTR